MNEIIPGCPLFKDKTEPNPNIPLEKPVNPLKEIWDWYRKVPVKPYVDVRGLNGDDISGIGHTAIEVGVKFSF